MSEAGLNYCSECKCQKCEETHWEIENTYACSNCVCSKCKARVQQEKIDLCEYCLPKPFEGIDGYWVYRSDCNKQKSFGYYECSKCYGKWTSAHAQKDYKQACKSCNFYSLPLYMWENEYPFGHIKINRDDDKPHLSQLCEACHKGVCIVTSKRNDTIGNYERNSYSNSNDSYDDYDNYDD